MEETLVRVTAWKWKKEVLHYSNLFGIDFDFLMALVETESSGEPYASKYEPHYPYLEQPSEFAARLGITRLTEETLQRTSFGLCQVMGGVAREWGFQDHLMKLVIPEICFEIACKHILKKMKRYGSDPCTLYAAYNRGSIRKNPDGTFSNQKHVDRFYTILLSVRNLIAIEKRKKNYE